MEKNYYVNQLEDKDFDTLFNEIQLYVNISDKLIKIDYSIQTPIKRVIKEGTKPYCTLFVRDFSCSLSNADTAVRANIKRIYRKVMLEKFKETNYAQEAEMFDAKQLEKQNSKTL